VKSVELKVRYGGQTEMHYQRPDFPIKASYYLPLSPMKLAVGSFGYEHVVVLLAGELLVQGDVNMRLKRESVFVEGPSAVYVGPGKNIEVSNESSAEYMVISCEAVGEGMAQAITDVPAERRGKSGYLRTIYDIIPEKFPAKRLVVGETINDLGNWSSFPPHKHDVDSLQEVSMKEIYFFKLQPENGFGFQRIYDAEGELDETMTIENNDFVWIPKGYHPVAVMPGHKIYYLWVLIGTGRVLLPNTQDNFRWLL
jgi:5-deoxy-glucuronate isomerase